MAVTEPGRSWTFDSSTWEFPHRFFNGFHPNLGRVNFHFNPGMVLSAARQPPTWLLLGGSWVFPTVIALLFSQQIIAADTKLLLWSEANVNASEHPSRPANIVRRFIFGRADAYVIPGTTAERTLAFWRVPPKPVLQLPNVVDERTFRDGVIKARQDRLAIRQRLGTGPEDLLVFIPARLHEPTKGLLNFLEAIESVACARLRIIIAGEGPDRSLVEARLGDGKLKGQVLGHQTQEQIVKLFAAADVMALPSWKDPNPLTVIEALWAGLPLVISKYCGNSPEAVEEGCNGWLIEPADHAQIRAVFHEVLAMPSTRLAEFGAASLRIATRFATDSAVERFVDQLDRC